MTKLTIFDVEHGQCALLESDGEHILIDCGHNGSTGWRPSDMLWRRGIKRLDALIITNGDEDHASDLPNVLDVATIGRVYSNPTVSGRQLRGLKGQDDCGPGIDALCRLLTQFEKGRTVAEPPWCDGLNIRCCWNDYPRHFDDENNLSLVTLLQWHDFSICFPGDVEKAGWLRLLQDSDFKATMRGVDVLVASHHGRESGYFEPLFKVTGLAPKLVVISDKGIEHATQETVARYRAKATGIMFPSRERRVLTTRSDGKVDFTRVPSGWRVDTWRNW